MRVAVVAVPCAALDDTPPDAHAAEIETDVSVYLAANSFAKQGSDGWDHFETMAASVELTIDRAGSSWSANIVNEYHLSDDSRVDGTVLAGLQLNYGRGDWDTSGFWFMSRFPRQPSRATVMTKTRYEFAPGQRLGGEYLALANDLESGELKLGYYGSVFDSVSFKLLPGSAISGGWSPVTRLQVVWHAK